MPAVAAPYASIIVPTHDRAATLPFAIKSVQQQTVRDIEIIIAGDGATPEVREIARALAASDDRIDFQDRAKAPGRGAINRDLAVRSARAPRIFYTDDDDLLYDTHIATLGPMLEMHDAVDSAVASVSKSGHLQRSLLNHASGAVRDALIERRAKFIFDTHFAHTKACYLDAGHAWSQEGDVVWNFLIALLSHPSRKWLSLPRITALSFHGAARRHWSAARRVEELERWQNVKPQHGFLDWYFFRALLDVPIRESTVSGSLDAAGVAEGPRESVVREDQYAELERVRRLAAGQGPLDEISGDLLIRLADPILGGRPDLEYVVGAVLQCMTAKDALAAMEAARPRDPHSREIQIYFQHDFELHAKNPKKALGLVASLIKQGPIYHACAHERAAVSARICGDQREAARHAEMAAAAEHDA